MNTKRGQKQNAALELWKVNLATWIRTLTLSHSLSLHLLSSNFVLIHLIISSIILPPPSHPSAPHDCLFIYPFTPLSLTAPSRTQCWPPYFLFFPFINLSFLLSLPLSFCVISSFYASFFPSSLSFSVTFSQVPSVYSSPGQPQHPELVPCP